MQKYELLALLPLTGTDEELKAVAGKIEQRLIETGGTIAGSMALQKGRLPYSILNLKQGYYHLIQFAMEESAVSEFRRALTLSGDTLRFDIKRVAGDFKKFIPSAPRVSPSRSIRVVPQAMPGAGNYAHSYARVVPAPVVYSTALSQEAVKTEEVKKVSIEEIDKRLEEILAE